MKYYNGIFFTIVPLKGYYRFKEEFQIYPMDLPDVPRKEGIRHYPNMIEYVVRDDEEIKVAYEEEFSDLNDLSSRTATTVTKRNRILSLLTAFSNSLFFDYEAMEGCWGLPVQSEDLSKLNDATSVWCMKVFYFPTIKSSTEISQFSALTVPKVKLIQHQLFYQFKPNLDADRTNEMLLPSTLDEILESYFSLDREARIIIDTAISYTASAVELKDKRRTLSLLASFTSLETMVNLEYKDVTPTRCSTCNQLQFSIAKKFREYLLKYLGDSPHNKRKFNQYYSLRSKIVHTGQQLKTEKLWSNLSEEEEFKERITRVEILQIGKIAMANWLIMRLRFQQRQNSIDE